jgi:hypothetical protein
MGHICPNKPIWSIRTALLMRSDQAIAGWSCGRCSPIRARAHYVALSAATPSPINVRFFRACVRFCVRAFLRACVRFCVFAFLRFCVFAFLRFCVFAFLRFCVRACVRACVRVACVRAFLRA